MLKKVAAPAVPMSDGSTLDVLPSALSPDDQPQMLV